MAKRQLIKAAYSAIQEYNGLLRDKAWESLYKCIDNISDKTGAKITMGAGVYKVSADGLTHWREYSLELNKDGIKVEGLLTAHAAGTLSDPFKCYDLTMLLW